MAIIVRSVFRIVLIFSVFKLLLASQVHFKKIECTTLNKSIFGFDECVVKSVNRSFSYFTIKTKIFRFPLTNLKVRSAILKLSNGYKPFMYNLSLDVCKFLASKRLNVLYNFYYNLVAEFMPIHYTCPVYEDIVFEKVNSVSIGKKLTNVIPFPLGHYCVHTTWSTDGKEVSRILVYGQIF